MILTVLYVIVVLYIAYQILKENEKMTDKLSTTTTPVKPELTAENRAYLRNEVLRLMAYIQIESDCSLIKSKTPAYENGKRYAFEEVLRLIEGGEVKEPKPVGFGSDPLTVEAIKEEVDKITNNVYWIHSGVCYLLNFGGLGQARATELSQYYNKINEIFRGYLDEVTKKGAKE